MTLVEHEHFSCVKCPKRFKRKKYLTQHHKTHTNERPYRCSWPECNQRYKYKRNLTYHTNLHTGENPYQCCQIGCVERFRTPEGLVRHCREAKHEHRSPKRSLYSSENPDDCSSEPQMGEAFRTPSQFAMYQPISAVALGQNSMQNVGDSVQPPLYVVVQDHPGVVTSQDIAEDSANIYATSPLTPRHAGHNVAEVQQSMQHPPPPHAPLQYRTPLQSQDASQVQHPSIPCQTQSSIHPSLEQRLRNSRSKHITTSPFSDCLDSFGRKFTLQTFSRPVDGKVNGYIKFLWPQKGGRRPSRAVEAANPDHDGDSALSLADASKPSVELALQGLSYVPPSTSTTTLQPGSDSPFSTWSTLAPSQSGGNLQTPIGSVRSYGQGDTTENPRFPPPQLGHHAVIDTMGRKLIAFYIRNWCPGRTVLRTTNAWLHFVSKQHSPGILAAIQSLAGIYVHDYLPDDRVQRQVNEKFTIAEARLRQLLKDIRNLDYGASSELVTLASLLSMQDVVLTERRLRKPYHPRWLMGFKQAATVLELTDSGNRFYKESNVQVSVLRLSQSVIVGRAVILAQPMMPLPFLATFDPIFESSRFGFLLDGSKAGMFEIHGGCGFSKRVLYVFNQVSYCSTRLLQDRETPIVPAAADLLYDQLLNLHQWSSEYENWEDVQSKRQPIEWIRKTDESFVVQKAEVMTEVTAEAWRLAAMVYLQCRLFRLPRNHPEVVANLADLAKSISIMPTSGFVFTAQAPLLPVFFLGLLATVEEHVQLADAWFQQVIHTPVRSSVPPVFKSLERIQSWMNQEIPVPAPNVQLPQAIAERQPWWERMVSKVQDKETEVLCLT